MELTFPDPGAYRLLKLGNRVDRAAASLPQSTATPYFTVANGRCLIALLGEVTTVIQAQATATKWIHNPTVGTDLDMTNTLDITGDEVGTLYTLPPALGSAMIGAGQAGVLNASSYIVKPGTLDLSTGASSTGATKWSLWYLPLDEGASVVAA